MLSNKEVVDIVASAPARPSAARKLVEQAVRAWRTKYPTSKVDDCAVVCLFLDSAAKSVSIASATKSKEQNEVTTEKEDFSVQAGLSNSGTVQNANDVPGEEIKGEAMEGIKVEASENEELSLEIGKEWSALEGVSRVNTMLTLPRFVPNKEDKKAAGESKKRK